ncbi:hypothetical protein FA95DRAFT_1005108 [Auriscalpium vulgare]|uniref:Uncharacterized protein n=1 Tax=Auriscalpium vulgare TaxID=40419 RepID=A0ACB8RY20_9AGAM|nr:hypothetical protein FA95DRAFT_1005108 [Auriscalpium vulgare]
MLCFSTPTPAATPAGNTTFLQADCILRHSRSVQYQSEHSSGTPLRSTLTCSGRCRAVLCIGSGRVPTSCRHLACLQSSSSSAPYRAVARSMVKLSAMSSARKRSAVLVDRGSPRWRPITHGATGVSYALWTLTALSPYDTEYKFFGGIGATPAVAHWGLGCALLYSALGAALGWRRFDYWARLSGAAFGALYYRYGMQLWDAGRNKLWSEEQVRKKVADWEVALQVQKLCRARGLLVKCCCQLGHGASRSSAPRPWNAHFIRAPHPLTARRVPRVLGCLPSRICHESWYVRDAHHGHPDAVEDSWLYMPNCCPE